MFFEGYLEAISNDNHVVIIAQRERKNYAGHYQQEYDAQRKQFL